jgi:hypothetical protein
MLKTCGQTTLHVDLRVVDYIGTFHVLPGNVPLIFGMSFLGEQRPVVDWGAKTVSINGKLL